MFIRKVLLFIALMLVLSAPVYAESYMLEDVEDVSEQTSVPKDAYTVSMSSSGNKLTIEGSARYDYLFGGLYIDGVLIKTFYSQSIPRQSVSLADLDTGYHTAFLQLYDNYGILVRMIFKEKIAVNKITAKPTYKGKFEVYSKHFNFYPYNMVMSNQSGPLYMEYRTGKSWKRTGSMQANPIKLYIEQGFKIGKLKPSRKYKTRIRYGTYVTYPKIEYSDFGLTLDQFRTVFNTTKSYVGDGKNHFFGGPVLNTKTIKTGKGKKPSIRSVFVKATNIKFHKNRVAGHYEWTGYHYVWIGPFTEKFYTCKYKVKVNLKKKPGTKGIWVNGKYLKGNKKSYTTTFTPYPNYFTKKPPKGLKVKVQVKSYQNKGYGGFSPTYSKKIKVR